MKTPKRFKFSHMRCEFCQCVSSVDNEDNENGWFSCPYCGKVSKFKDEGFAHVSLYARWKRKNREARLRHALRKKDEIIDYAANVVQRMENEASDEYALQRQAWNAVMFAADLRCAELSARSWKKRYRDIWRMQFWTTSAYGQDVEGS